MRIKVAMMLLLLMLPIFADTCSDLTERLRILETQNTIDHSNLQAFITMQNNQSKNYIEARFNLDKNDRDSSFSQLQKHIDEKIYTETSPIKQVIPSFLTSLATVCSVLTFLVWRGH